MPTLPTNIISSLFEYATTVINTTLINNIYSDPLGIRAVLMINFAHSIILYIFNLSIRFPEETACINLIVSRLIFDRLISDSSIKDKFYYCVRFLTQRIRIYKSKYVLFVINGIGLILSILSGVSQLYFMSVTDYPLDSYASTLKYMLCCWIVLNNILYILMGFYGVVFKRLYYIYFMKDLLNAEKRYISIKLLDLIGVRTSLISLPKCTVTEDICIICREEFTNNTEIFVTKCKHMFCLDCAINLINTQTACPTCKEEFPLFTE